MSTQAAESMWPPLPGRRMLRTSLPALRRIGVVLHPTRDVSEPLAAIGRWARREGVSVVVAASATRRPLPLGVDPVPEASFAGAREMLIALGGDGTMLAIRHRAAAELAVNDIVLRRASGAPLADVGVHVGADEVARCRGDGVIVATPTGSTGYSLAAGGPLVSPRLAVTIVTPLAGRNAPSSAIVLPAGEPIELRVRDESAPLVVEIDGHQVSVTRPSARLRVGRSA